MYLNENTLEDRQAIIKKLRILLGISQKEIAEKAGIPLLEYQKIEDCKISIKTAPFDLVCRIMCAIEDPRLMSHFYYGTYDFLLDYDITLKDPDNKKLLELCNQQMKKLNNMPIK